MLKILQSLKFFKHVDPRVYELQKDVEFYQLLLFGSILLLVLLGLIIYIQRRYIKRLKGEDIEPKQKRSEKKKKVESTQTASVKAALVNQNDLPDPGLIFKFSLAQENVTEKLVTVGQMEGNIKTFSTEIIDDHLSLYIRIIDNQRDRDIYNLPDKIVEEYQVDLRRDGKVTLYYPGIETYREMGSRERLYIKETPDEGGEPTFAKVEASQPIRFRLGDRLNQDNKFTGGYFEFHLFTKDYSVQTKAGIPKIEKYFFLRLYKIYPGYDTGAPTEDGLFPMIDPFTTG